MPCRNRSVLGALAGAALLLPSAVSAQVVPAPLTPQVGSSNPVSAEPNVPRPTSAPCTVALFTDLQFADYGTKPIAYTPGTDAGCAGPWSKVVLTADFTVTAGRQFDRTAKFYLGGANIYFGTTAEPRSTLSPSWHIERDVTDLSALFRSPETGIASIQNIVNSTYTGVIYASAKLLFYPVNAANPAAAVPDQVLSFPVNDTTSLNTTADQAKGTFTFPLNLERVYLDVIAESQGNDEFWYLCVPSPLAGELQSCGSTAFRETEVSIDGRAAGVAPVYPWIYTGGIDPYLWEPITGIETLNFKPYRVDLTPFAGVLNDGQPHTVAVSVTNASSRFDVTSSLLLYTDHGQASTSGTLTENTLTAAPSPVVEQSLNTAADGTVSGPVSVRSQREWKISGYLLTSHGRVDTTVEASNSFFNLQDEKVSNLEYKQDVSQSTEQTETTTTATSAGTVQTQHNVSYPLIVNYRYAPNDNNDGGVFVTTSVKQGKVEALRSPVGANSPNPIVTQEVVETTDTLHYNAAGSFTGHDANTASSQFGGKDATHRCYFRRLTADRLVLTSVDDSTSCSVAP